MKKRLSAALLALVLIVGLLPTAALAVDDPDSSVTYLGLTISCAEGDIAEKVVLRDGAGNENRYPRKSAIVIKETGNYTISGTWDTAQWECPTGWSFWIGAVLIVDENVKANITLDNVTIRPDLADDGGNKIETSSGIVCEDGSVVELRLVGENTIYGRGWPAVELAGNANVTITGDGSLEAVCGKGKMVLTEKPAGLVCSKKVAAF